MILAACLTGIVVLSGCGLGPGKSTGSAEMLVTRDYGGTELESKSLDLNESTTVMRALDENTTIETRYGGKFVTSINDLKNSTEDGRSNDWFYFVDGVAGNRSASDYTVTDGDRIWWDYRDWSSASEALAVIGSFPAPLVGGFDGKDPGVSLQCMGGGLVCDQVDTKLLDLGARVTLGSDRNRIRVLVGPWSKVRTDPLARRLEDGPQTSGVFANFQPHGPDYDLNGLNQEGETVRNFGTGAALIAATRKGNQMPAWVVTAGSVAGLSDAPAVLTPELLARHYAAVVFDKRIAPLPLP